MLTQQQVSPPDFTVRGLADKLHVSERHVRECISQGKIPSYKVGRIRRIPAEAVEILRSGRTAADDDLDAQIRAIVDAAPPLTRAQRDKLAVLLAADEPEPAPKAKRRSASRGSGAAR
jgi:excisionase family DNA binding protein